MNILPRISYWPDTGERIVGANTPPSVQEWRHSNPDSAWLYNPWSGTKRLSKDVAADLFGRELVPPESYAERHAKYYFEDVNHAGNPAVLESVNQSLTQLGAGIIDGVSLSGAAAGLMVVTRAWYAAQFEEIQRLTVKLAEYTSTSKPYTFIIAPLGVTELDISTLNEYLHTAPPGAGLSLTIAGNLQGLMVVRTEDHMRAAAQAFGLMGENSTLRQCIERAQVTLDDLNDTLQAAVAAPEGAG